MLESPRQFVPSQLNGVPESWKQFKALIICFVSMMFRGQMMMHYSRRPARLFHAIAVTLALASVPVAAQQVEQYRPIIAKELYDGIMSGGLASWVEDPAQRTALSTYMATSYIWAVADSTQGKQWCSTPSLDLVKMAESVLAYLDELPESRQSEGAAVIVAESLGKTYPCP